MTLPRQLLQIDYDQFQRYAALTVLLKPLLQAWQHEQKPLRILEVGSHALNLLPAFLAPLSIEIVRADLQPQYAGDVGPYVTIEPDRPLPFADQAFTVVVAMEVLEHIPPASRQHAIMEWSRIASEGIFFTCPNGDLVTDHERRADADFQSRHGRVHPWLEEHERFGRPTHKEVQRYCSLAQLTCQRFYNSPLAEWLPLLLATEHIFEEGDRDLFARFNAMLNERPFRAFIQEPAYRTLYACLKSRECAQQANALWQGHQSASITHHAMSENDLDPTRLLATRLSQFIIQQRRNEVDQVQLQALREKNSELEQQLACVEQTMAWLRREKESSYKADNISTTEPLNHAQYTDLQQIRPNQWHVSGNNPDFTWPCQHRRGWHRIELVGQVAAGHSVKVFLDYGNGFSAEHLVHLGTWKHGLDRLAVNAYFHHPVVRLRLIPCQGTFTASLIIDGLTIEPVSTAWVALQGIGRLANDLYLHPRLTWQTLVQSPSWLRLGMQHTSTPRGLPIGATTEYQRWLLEHRLTPAQRRTLARQHQNNRTKIVVFMRGSQAETPDALIRTLRSLAQQDVGCWELWCAADRPRQKLWQSIPEVQALGDRLHWLKDRPQYGEARLLNQCLKQSRANWLISLRPGTLLEQDAFLQVLEAARKYPSATVLVANEGQLLAGEGQAALPSKPLLTNDVLKQDAGILGEAVVLHGPTLRRQAGFHAAYEGALILEYVHRMLSSQKIIIQLDRVLMHAPPRPPVSRGVQQVIDRIVERDLHANYRISCERIAIPAHHRLNDWPVRVKEIPAVREDGA